MRSMLYSRAFRYAYVSRSSVRASLLSNENNAPPPPPTRWIILARTSSSGSKAAAAAAAAAAGFLCVTTSTSMQQPHHLHHHQQQRIHHHDVRHFHSSSNKTLMEAAGGGGVGSSPKKNEDDDEALRRMKEAVTFLETTKTWREQQKDNNNNDKNKNKTATPTSTFWETLTIDFKEMKKDLDEIISDVNELMIPDKPKSSSSSSPSSPLSSVDSLASVGSALMKLLIGGGRDDDEKVITAEEIIKRARENAAAASFDENNNVSNSEQDGSTLLSILQILDTYKDKLDQVADLYMGSIDMSQISPTALYYYVEHEDEIKNPSWKRRVHRYYPGIDVSKMQEINDACDLAYMAYADDVNEIESSLTNFRIPYALVHANVNSQPGKPASFLAVQKYNNDDQSSLEVLLCVRGTKTIADAVTDVICNVQPYRGGTAHSLILQSGQYLAQTYTPLLHELLKSSGKNTINLTVIGHSMGAGAATIAGMELNDDDKIQVQRVVGFGCPALLSKDLAENVPFVSTIINDNDMIPRMSGVSAANLLMKIMDFDWLPFAKRDVRHAVEELNRSQPILFNQQVCDKILGLIEPFLEQNLQTTTTTINKNNTTKQQRQLLMLEPELFPPGQCIHFYRDGIGVSVNVVPNTFFGEIDFNRRMLDDHLIHNGYQQIFLDLMRQQKKDHHFKFNDQRESKSDG